MADRHGERIRGVVRRGNRVETEQQLDHLLNLVLFRAAEPDHRSLDFCRRVFDDRKAGLRCRQQRNAPRMSELQRTADIARVEDGFHGDTIRPVPCEQRDEIRVDELEFVGKCRTGGRRNRSADDEVVAAALYVDAAVPGALGAGIDPENLHANEASISFSSMSALDQTFFVSSCSSSASISLTICCACLPSSFT